MLKGYRLRDYDFKLVIMVLALSIIGYLAVGSAKEALQEKQMFGIIAGFVLMIGLSLFDYKLLLKLLEQVLKLLQRYMMSFIECLVMMGKPQRQLIT